MGADATPATVADRLAIIDVVVRYFELVDAKGWNQMHEVFTDDTTTRWTPDSLVEGRDNIVGAMQHMIGSDEIVTYHHPASMAPVVDGDRAEVTVRVRAMHYGTGPRAGQFYESLGVQPTRLVRTRAGWRIAHHEWQIVVKLGDREELFAPEIAAGKPY
jgi:SnoaL-like domain